MSNIQINDDFRAMMLKQYFNGNQNIHIMMFDGTMPTDQERQTYVDACRIYSGDWLYAQDLEEQFTTVGNYTKLFELDYNSLSERRMITQTSIDFLLSQRSESAFGLAEGTAGWFWLFQYGTNFTYSHWHLMGTVGAIDSGADLELKDPVISTTRSYKLNDLTVDFNLQVQTQL